MSDAEKPRPGADGSVDQIEDVQDLKQRRKLQSLLDAEENVREMRKKAKLGEREGTSVGVVGYRANVEDYLMAIRPLVKTENSELWTGKRLGSLTIHPPETSTFFDDLPKSELDENDLPRFGTVSGVRNLQAKTVTEFHGLESLLDAPSQFTASWTVFYTPPAGGRRRIQKSRTVDLPRNIVDKAFEEASDFADKHGFGLDRNSGRPFNEY